MAGRKSLILVTVDCLRADHCGFMGYGRRTTPFLDELAAQSFVFPNAIVAGVPTYYSFPAILASRYPLALGREVVGLAPRETNLASVLNDDGFKTAFFGAGNPYLTPQFGYDFGFDTFRDFVASDAPQNLLKDLPSGQRAPSKLNHALAEISHKVPGIRAAYDELYFQYCWRRGSKESRSFDELRRFPAADVIVREAQDWLASSAGDVPFFIWLHFMDPHGPYYPKEESLELLHEHGLTPLRARYLNASWNRSDIGEDRLRKYRDEVVSMYDAGISWMDLQISRLIESLRKSHRWDDCILAFTADHGEKLLDHDGRYHPPSLTEELIHVPLLLRVPGAEKKDVCSNPFSLLHLAPTLLSAAGSTLPADFQGTNYWGNVQSGTAWTTPAIAECVAGCTNPFRHEQRRGPRQLAIRESRYKLVLNLEAHSNADTGPWHEALFDLESDPMESAPLPKEANKCERGRLLHAARHHLQASCSLRDSDSYFGTRVRDIKQNLSGAPNGSPFISVESPVE